MLFCSLEVKNVLRGKGIASPGPSLSRASHLVFAPAHILIYEDKPNLKLLGSYFSLFSLRFDFRFPVLPV